MRNVFLKFSFAALTFGSVLSFDPASVSLVKSASAGTYEDNVFRPGEPRWGGDRRRWEDRNVYRGGYVHPYRRHYRQESAYGQQKNRHWRSWNFQQQGQTVFIHRGRILVKRQPAYQRAGVYAPNDGYYGPPRGYRRGYGQSAPVVTFRQPEERGTVVVYERSETGECGPGFRFVPATGECI